MTQPRIIVVVDDEPLIRWSLGESLKQAGFEVLEARNAATALSHFNPQHDGVAGVLLDYNLPDSDGIEVLRGIRATHPDTPVVMMTAYGTPEVQRQAEQLAVAAFIDKPFDVNAVVALVRRLVLPQESGSSPTA